MIIKMIKMKILIPKHDITANINLNDNNAAADDKDNDEIITMMMINDTDMVW